MLEVHVEVYVGDTCWGNGGPMLENHVGELRWRYMLEKRVGHVEAFGMYWAFPIGRA